MEALLKELSDIDHKLMRFGWGMQREDDGADTQEEEETDSDDDEDMRQAREQEIIIVRQEIMDELMRTAGRHIIIQGGPPELVQRQMRIYEEILWRLANGSIENYRDRNTLRQRLFAIMMMRRRQQR